MFTPEFRLITDLCRPALCSKAPKTVPSDKVDWSAFQRLVSFHRVEGVVKEALSRSSTEIPATIRHSLADGAQAIAAKNLRSLLASHELHKRFAAAGVPLIFLKGVTLGVLAYGNVSVKAGVDIDVLVDPADLVRAAELLRESGYHLSTPNTSSDDRVLRAWHRISKESLWTNKPAGLQLDLHSRTADNPWLIPHIDVHSTQQLVDVGFGIRLPTFTDEELFAYLTVHGASSAWFRLKWVVDLVWFLQGRKHDEIEWLFHRSQGLGAGRAAGQALLLADVLFGTLTDNTALRNRIQSDRSMFGLARAALRQVTSNAGEPTERRWGTLRIHWTQLSLAAGLRYKFTELSSQLVRTVCRQLLLKMSSIGERALFR